MKTMEINGETFEVVKAETKKGQDIILTYHNWVKEWNDLYKNPSTTKERIKEYWKRFFVEIGASRRGYRGNSMRFSIYSKTAENYFLITADHNYVVV